MVDKPPRVCGRRKNWAMSRLAVAVVGGGGEVRKAREAGGIGGVGVYGAKDSVWPSLESRFLILLSSFSFCRPPAHFCLHNLSRIQTNFWRGSYAPNC